MTTTKKQIIGSVSSGTMRSEDLIPCFLDTIAYFDKRRAAKLRKEFEAMPEGSEEIECFLGETLFDVLNEYALPYFYFGSHPGDGADYGFWLSESMAEDFEGLKVSDLSEVPKDYYGEVLHVNDHGNMSLCISNGRGKLMEIWAIV